MEINNINNTQTKGIPYDRNVIQTAQFKDSTDFFINNDGSVCIYDYETDTRHILAQTADENGNTVVSYTQRQLVEPGRYTSYTDNEFDGIFDEVVYECANGDMTTCLVDSDADGVVDDFYCY